MRCALFYIQAPTLCMSLVVRLTLGSSPLSPIDIPLDKPPVIARSIQAQPRTRLSYVDFSRLPMIPDQLFSH